MSDNLSEGARTYLMELEKKRQQARARGGAEADAALVKTQTDKAKYLSGDDDKFSSRLANRTVNNRKNFEAQQRAKKQNRRGIDGGVPNKRGIDFLQPKENPMK